VTPKHSPVKSGISGKYFTSGKNYEDISDHQATHVLLHVDSEDFSSHRSFYKLASLAVLEKVSKHSRVLLSGVLQEQSLSTLSSCHRELI